MAILINQNIIWFDVPGIRMQEIRFQYINFLISVKYGQSQVAHLGLTQARPDSYMYIVVL